VSCFYQGGEQLGVNFTLLAEPLPYNGSGDRSFFPHHS
jgi:hypothetical protein